MSFHQQIKTDMYKIIVCTTLDQQISRMFLRQIHTMESFTIFTSPVLPLSETTRLGMQPEVTSEVQK